MIDKAIVCFLTFPHLAATLALADNPLAIGHFKAICVVIYDPCPVTVLFLEVLYRYAYVYNY